MSRKNNFALLHLIGAFLVLTGHFFIMHNANPNSAYVPSLFGSQIHGIGVEMLFIISGFLVCTSIVAKEKKLHRYYIEKFIRIFPPFIVCLIISILVGWFVTTEKNQYYWIGSWQYLWKNSLMNIQYYIPGYFSNVPYANSVNGSIWTLPIEFSLYLILPLFVYPFKALKSTNSKALMFGLGGLFTLLFFFFGIFFDLTGKYSAVFWGTDWTRACRLAFFFFAGVISAFFINAKEDNKKYFNIVVAVIFMFISTLFAPYQIPSNIARYLFLPYLVISIAFAKPILNDFFNKHDYAYGIYLYGFPVTQFAILISMNCGNDFTNNGVALLVYFSALVVIIICGMFSYYCVEKPVNKLYLFLREKISNTFAKSKNA